MKLFFLFTIVLLLTFSHASAQPCKVVTPGMSGSEVIRFAGHPTDTVFLGYAKGKDTISIWNYGNQQVIFESFKVERVVADVKKENQLQEQMIKGMISKEEFAKKTDQLNRESCQK